MRFTEIELNGQAFSMPAITLGSVYFGTRVDKETAFSILDAYVEQGGNWLDTARVYGVGLLPAEQRTVDVCDSEELIGQWLRERDNRDSITLVTKGGHWELESKEPRLTPQCIREDLDASLKALGAEYTDIYFLHWDDPGVSVETLMPALHQLVQDGRARVLGASNWSTERIEQANAFARENGLTPFSISQVKWSYAVAPVEEGIPDIERDASQYEAYVRMGMPVMAYSSQAAGFFVKTAKLGFEPELLGRAADYFSEENLKRARAVMELTRREKISPSASAFSYLWSRGVPVTAMVGPSSAEHLLESMTDCDYAPGEALVDLLEGARW